MGNAENLPLSHAGQDIGYVAVVLTYMNKVRVVYETPEIKAALFRKTNRNLLSHFLKR